MEIRVRRMREAKESNTKGSKLLYDCKCNCTHTHTHKHTGIHSNKHTYTPVYASHVGTCPLLHSATGGDQYPATGQCNNNNNNNNKKQQQ